MTGAWMMIQTALKLLVACVAINAADAKSPKPGDTMPILMPDDFEQLHLVSWRVEQGRPDPQNPLLEPQMPWDAGGVMSHGTIARDPLDGLWKAWQISTPAEPELDGVNADHHNQRRLTYLESPDGINWTRPRLKHVSWPGYDKTNILLDHASGGACTYASVLIDPHRESWPYEMFIMREPACKNPSKTVGGLPPPKGKRAIYRYRSRDGKKWHVFQGPLKIVPSDISFIYQTPAGGYVNYFKTYIDPPDWARIIPYDNNGSQRLRALAVRTSPDGTHWNDRRVVMKTDWRDPNHLQFMELNPLKLNGGYVGLVTVYDAITQTIYLQMAASRDGLNWWTVARRPALPNPPLGDYGGGMIWQMKNLIRHRERLYVYYSGTEGIHAEIFDTRIKPRLEARGITTIGIMTPTLPFVGALCRASWDVHRMWALCPSAGGMTGGAAVTHTHTCKGKTLWVNIRTRKQGALRAELRTPEGDVIAGFAKQDCQRIQGDHHAIRVSWKGGRNAPRDARVKFYLTRAFLYGYEWR
jgi:hypothetical protein